MICHKYNCSGLFHCVFQSKSVCLHPIEICDGRKDCFSGEDEYLCESNRKCPSNCQCLMYTSSCLNSMYDSISFTYPNLAFIKFINITVTFRNTKLLDSNNIIAFIWSHSN